jgi:hypothetical protein
MARRREPGRANEKLGFSASHALASAAAAEFLGAQVPAIAAWKNIHAPVAAIGLAELVLEGGFETEALVLIGRRRDLHKADLRWRRGPPGGDPPRGPDFTL